MDNDNAIKKFLVRTYRNLRLKIEYKKFKLLDAANGNKKIAELLKQNDPFMVARFGAVEMHCVSKWMQNLNCSAAEKDQALFAAGIFPNDQDTINEFCKVYTESAKQCDVLGVWEVVGEKKAINRYCPEAFLTPCRAIEPYYHDEPWSANLKGKKVLIIHPFVDTIKSQLTKRSKLWNNQNTLPEFAKVSFLKAVQSNAGGKTTFATWFEALEYMKSEIEKIDFDVAIIGAGAYGLPLAAHCKSIGKQAIQMAGATQILFGIKGKRWDNHPVISKFYNECWVRPSENETPPQTQKVEGGSYW